MPEPWSHASRFFFRIFAKGPRSQDTNDVALQKVAMRMTSNSVRDEPLHDEHVEYLARQAHAIGVPAHEVDDVVQDTLLKAIELMPAFRGDAKKTTWLYKILLNVWRNGNRRIARRTRKHLNYAAECRANEPGRADRSEFEAEASLALGELHDFVDSLSPEEREAFIARALRGLGRREAAAWLNIEPAVLDRRFGSANVRFDDRFGHRRLAKPPSSRKFGIFAPVVKWWTSSSVGPLLSIFACVAGGLWLIAVTTPHPRPRQLNAATVARADPARPSDAATRGAAAQSPTPIEVRLEGRRPKRAVRPSSSAPPPNPPPDGDTRHLALGRALRYENRLAEALTHLRAIDSRGPLARERWGNEVGVLCEMQRLDEAIAVAKEWLATHPGDFVHLNRSCVSDQP
jgi:RNA polymerase sigma factor (sigma-70 family)